MIAEYSPKRFTTQEYNLMMEAGILREDDRVELVAGEIIEMSPVGKRHISCVNRVSALLYKAFGQSAIISVQNPIDLDGESQPQPDICVLKHQDDYYAERMSRPEDIILLIEVAETSARYDRIKKMPAYARAGISETWLIDLEKQVVEVYSEPTTGGYKNRRLVRPGQQINSASLPEQAISVNSIFGIPSPKQ